MSPQRYQYKTTDTGTQTEAEPALVHVDSEGGDESKAEVVAERPGVGVGAKVPADQRAVDGGVRQHRLSARVKMVDVDRTAVLLQVQRPESKDARVNETRHQSVQVFTCGCFRYLVWNG